MSDRKRRILLAVLTVMVLIALLATAFWPTNNGDSAGAHGTETVDIDKRKPEPTRKIPMQPEKVCEKTAPEALSVYATDSPGRQKKLRHYFAANARGISVPASDILPQPATGFSGSLAFGQEGDTAVCSVWTGLESPWYLTFTYHDHDGWMATSVEGPAQGAYRNG